MNELLFRRNLFAQESANMLLNGLLPQKLNEMFLAKARIQPDMPCEKLTQNTLDELLKHITDTTVTVTEYRDFEFAQVCTGGIPASQIKIETLESKFMPHVYFAGEILDVDGICGGYNLHFAWATGVIAGSQ